MIHHFWAAPAAAESQRRPHAYILHFLSIFAFLPVLKSGFEHRFYARYIIMHSGLLLYCGRCQWALEQNYRFVGWVRAFDALIEMIDLRHWLRVPSNCWSWGRTIGYVKFCSIREGNEKSFQVDLWHFNNSDNLISIQDMEDRLLWNILILASWTALVNLKEAGSPDPFLMQLEFLRCRKIKRSSTKTSLYQALMRTWKAVVKCKSPPLFKKEHLAKRHSGIAFNYKTSFILNHGS